VVGQVPVGQVTPVVTEVPLQVVQVPLLLEQVVRLPVAQVPSLPAQVPPVHEVLAPATEEAQQVPWAQVVLEPEEADAVPLQIVVVGAAAVAYCRSCGRSWATCQGPP
jgi:hypothetical protein